MRRGRLIITGAVAVCLLAGLILWPTAAQTQQSPPAGGPQHQPGAAGPPQGLSAEMQETLQLYMIFRLTEELELSDEQALTIMPLVKEREQLRWDHHQQRQEWQDCEFQDHHSKPAAGSRTQIFGYLHIGNRATVPPQPSPLQWQAAASRRRRQKWIPLCMKQ